MCTFAALLALDRIRIKAADLRLGLRAQAGGELGYGFGNSRFARLLRAHARLPMAEQARALDEELERYRGSLPQRDDITVLSFRFD